jgi:hypothetical protein
VRPFLTFPVALGILATLTAVGIALSVVAGHRELIVVVLVLVGVLAVWFLIGYSKRPGPLPRRARGPESLEEDEEPFDDPVEFADRVASPGPEIAPGLGLPNVPAPIPGGPPEPALEPPGGPEPPAGPFG